MTVTREQFDQAQGSLKIAEANSGDFSPTGKLSPELVSILSQRLGQREKLFSFAVYSSILTLLLLVGAIVIQISVRVFGNENFEVMSSQALQVLSVSVFGQMVGIVLVIAKALWNDKDYINAMQKQQTGQKR
jgi:uncharacterized membrane protein